MGNFGFLGLSSNQIYWKNWYPTVTQGGLVDTVILHAFYLDFGPITFFQGKIDIAGSGSGNNAIIIGGQPKELYSTVRSSASYDTPPIGQLRWHNGGSWERLFSIYAKNNYTWAFVQYGEYQDAGVSPSDALSNQDQLVFSGWLSTQ